MNPAGQWYYLSGSNPVGPISQTKLAEMIRSGELIPSVQVAAAGWQQWQPAAAVFPELIPVVAPAPQPVMVEQSRPQLQVQPHPQRPAAQFAAPAPTAIPAVQLRCVAGPDNGKMFIISSAEVMLGRLSGIGQTDPSLADQHLALCWQNNALYYRMLNGQIRIDGVVPSPNGVLQLGQSFQMGSSMWQVNSQTATLGGLLDSLGKRLNSLASTEKLEGFSLSGMFSEVFKKRQQEEIDEYFICGTSKTTPPIEQAVTGWPKPWFFMRVLLFLLGAYFCLYLGWREFANTNLLPGMMMIGSMVLPLATVILFFELNTPRNVSFFSAIGLLCLGGVVSLFVALAGFQVSGLHKLLGPPAAGIIEEMGKLLTVIILARNTRQKYILNGLLFGAAVGAGFAIFESAGYAFNAFIRPIEQYIAREGGLSGDLRVFAGGQLTSSIMVRGLLSPFCHVAWTAIAAGALWRVKWDRSFSIGMLGNPMFWKAFLIPVVLHMIWNSPLSGYLFPAPQLVNGTVAWFIVFGIVQQGLKQVKREQLTQTKEELARTQSVVAAVTSSHNIPVLR